MTSLAAAAACSVLQITTRLGKKTAEAPGSSAAVTSRTPQHAPFDKTAAGAAGGDAAGMGAAALITQVTLIPRDGWGAVEPSVSPDGFGEHGPYDPDTNPSGWLVYEQPLETLLNEVVIHHSALPLTDSAREIQRLHMEEKGFADIGYHFLIDEKGQLFEGRSLKVRGAHTYGANYGTLGICLLGNFEEIQPTATQLAVLNILLTDLITRYPGINRMTGHRDHNPGVTLCPGANLYRLLPGMARSLNLIYGVN